MEGVMKYYNTGGNITYWDRQIGDYSDDCEVGGYIVYMTPSEVFQSKFVCFCHKTYLNSLTDNLFRFVETVFKCLGIVCHSLVLRCVLASYPRTA